MADAPEIIPSPVAPAPAPAASTSAVTQPEPAAATPPAGAAEAAPPAVLSSPEPAPAAVPAAEPVPERPASLLADPPKPADAAEPAKAPDAPAIVAEPVKYADFTLPETVKLDPAELGKYTEILGKHHVPQDAAQAMVDLYVAEQQRAQDAQVTSWNRLMEGWVSQFRDDPEIGKNRAETTINRAKSLLDRYATDRGDQRKTDLLSALSIGGLDRHPEVMRFLDWASSMKVERARPVPATVPQRPQAASRSERRYPSLNGAA